MNHEDVKTTTPKKKQAALVPSKPCPGNPDDYIITPKGGWALRCKAKSTTTKQRCKKPATHGKKVCRKHGANSLTGPAHPNWKGGGSLLRRDRWSMRLPQTNRSEYLAALNDPTLLSAEPEIAAFDVRMGEIIDRIREKHASWNELQDAWKEYEAAATAEGKAAARENLKAIIYDGVDSDRAWNTFASYAEKKQRLIESERKRLVEANLYMTREQAAAYGHALLEAVARNVKDKAAVVRIVQDFRSIIDAGSHNGGLDKWASYLEEPTEGAGHEPAGQQEARDSIIGFTRYTFGGFDENWHHRELASFLDRFVAGEITRGMILMPPRHSKTEFASRRLPGYIFGKRPDAKIISCSYTADLAYLISRDVKRIINDPAYRAVFPDTKIEGKDTDAFFEINSGKGYYRAAGIRGGVGGMGASYAIIDDPIKDAAEALSKTLRDAVWEWFTSTLYPRLEQPGSILLVMTPWHEDDLHGRLLKQAKEDPESDQWEVLRLPAIAEQDEEHRKKGEALWPLRFPIDRLIKIKKVIGRWFQALYQGRPTAEEGTSFQRSKLQIVDALPAGIWKWVRFWDVAATKDGGDYTVGTLIGQHPNGESWYVADIVRGQWASNEVDAIIKQTADADRAAGRHVKIREEQEPGSSGKSVIDSRKRRLAGYDYDGIRSTGEKTIRWNPFATQVNAGNVYLLRGSWNKDFIDELATVPGAENDDQADSSAGAFTEITLGSGASGMSVESLAGFGSQPFRRGFKR